MVGFVGLPMAEKWLAGTFKTMGLAGTSPADEVGVGWGGVGGGFWGGAEGDLGGGAMAKHSLYLLYLPRPPPPPRA